ncbi:MAG TPA: hypothetical protein VHX86_16425 [Tepidisphaeraceae bacterium]|nr:hypothetical protein [Tepidisphaeraceae bacterium]
MLIATPAAKAQVVITPGPGNSFDAQDQDQYHAQVVNNWCAIASMEMELDEPMVTGANAFVGNLIGQGDTVAQTYIYNLIHGAGGSAYNQAINNASLLPGLSNYSYYNPNAPYGSGSDIFGLQYGLNVLNGNNTGVPALGTVPNLGPVGTAYASFNVASLDYASRTIASAITQFQTPAIVGMNPNPFGILYGQLSGQHAISVYGVTTVGSAAAINANYTITGFYVHDPWTGYAMANLGQAQGLGENTWLRYGFDAPNLATSATVINVPNQGGVVLPVFGWANYFTPSYPSPTPYTPVFNSIGYKFEVEPQGPISVDTGDGGIYSSLPSVAPELSSQLNGSQAETDAVTDLTADDLNTEPGFEGGAFDTHAADQMLIQDPLDPSLQGDWIIPYDGSGGVNDVTGAVAVDEDTGLIDMATWFDPSDPITSMTLAQIDQQFEDQVDGPYPDDGIVPEPASLMLLLPGVGLLLRRRRA